MVDGDIEIHHLQGFRWGPEARLAQDEPTRNMGDAREGTAKGVRPA